jgi:two-component system, NarL family, nitrate/nitrite response regulator NarL
MRLMVVTNQPVVAAGFAAAVKALGGIEMLTGSPDDPALPKVIAAANPEIVLIDFVPEECFRLLLELRDLAPHCRTVLWVRKVSAEIAYQALNLGVSGILRTTESLLALERCLRAVSRGDSWFDDESKAAFFEARTVGLTPREAQLVILVAQGLKNKEIAAEAGVSEATVRIYLSAIFRKLKVKDRYELAIHGLQNMLALRSIGSSQPTVLPQQRPGRRVLFMERPKSPAPAAESQIEEEIPHRGSIYAARRQD